jgi:hypothetical protein
MIAEAPDFFSVSLCSIILSSFIKRFTHHTAYE